MNSGKSPNEVVSTATSAEQKSPDSNDILSLHQINLLQENIKVSESNRELRKHYAGNVYCFLVFYCIAVFIVLLLQGINCIPFNLPVSVLVTIAGSTAVSSIGLVGLVIRGLFKS